jgi:uncharacterized protein YrrD
LQIKRGASVFTEDNKHVGHVERVVIDPESQEISALVVQEGDFFTEDRILPFNFIASANENKIVIKAGLDLDRLPEFEETHFILLRPEDVTASHAAGDVIPLYWYPPYGFAPIGEAAFGPQIIDTEENIPEGTVPLEEGAEVISADDKQVGKVEEVLTFQDDDRISHFVIGGGVLSGERLIPVSWVKEIDEDEIHLIVKTSLLKKLPDYKK